MASHIPDPPAVSYWDVSPALRDLLRRRLSPGDFAWAEPQLRAMGELAAREVAPRAAVADRESPRLVTHTPAGERCNVIDYHPAYREMERIAYGSGMISMKYDPAVLAEHGDGIQTICFALGYLFAMAEMSLYCPACMTDGVARIVARFGSPDQAARVIPRMGAPDAATRWTGAMFVTERAGGSDVGANETIARPAADGPWLLTGQKWFCSNVDAQAVLVTARPEGAAAGTRGLETFLLLARGNPGVEIERIKDKLGVRSMPTGEVRLTDARAEHLSGFPAILEMMNLSRLYNSVASVAVIGRAIHEARYYIERRRSFGRPVVDHPLAQETLLDLEAEHRGALLLTFEAIDALARADRGDAEAARELRALIPLVKAVTGKLAVPCVSEAMELIGGNAYIEESPLPRLLRDAQVLPIWEGTTNILVLDFLRVAKKHRGHEPLLARVRGRLPDQAAEIGAAFEDLDERGARGWMDHLARALELTLLAEAGDTAAFERLAHRPLGLIPGAAAAAPRVPA
ncbi:MAG TPA: acyl-CoA dehydrogenase family protein [Thermoanaerobaculia bacterium]|nr:acyl-CoA dehydrogenase family protein [Thermoanaerobaculia bacterium]